MVFETLEELRLLVSCEPASNPSDPEWDAWLAAARALHAKTHTFRLLVVSEGGHPNRRQIERLAAMKHQMERLTGKGGAEPLTSIVSSSAAQRFVTSAMTFLNPAIRCFSPEHRGKAYAHLGLTPVEAKLAQAAVERLRGILGPLTAA